MSPFWRIQTRPLFLTRWIEVEGLALKRQETVKGPRQEQKAKKVAF